jgi:hypothetical protein
VNREVMMNMQGQTANLIDAITSFMEKVSQITEWFLVVLGVILFCYFFAKGTLEHNAADRGPGN